MLNTFYFNKNSSVFFLIKNIFPTKQFILCRISMPLSSLAFLDITEKNTRPSQHFPCLLFLSDHFWPKNYAKKYVRNRESNSKYHGKIKYLRSN